MKVTQVKQAVLSDPGDARAMLGLLDEYARGSMGGGQPLDAEVLQQLPGALNARRDCTVLLAFAEERAVGVLIAFQGFSTFRARPLMNIHDFAVTPDFQGQGVARMLYEHLKDLAVAAGCCKLTLEVLENNQRARAAYKRFGFRDYELDPAAGRALFMECKLD